MKHHSQKHKERYKLRNTKNTSNYERIGFITLENNSWQFVDYTDTSNVQSYFIRDNLSKQPLVEECPVKAILQDGQALIVETYAWEIPSSPINNRKMKNDLTEPKNYLRFGNFKILVIGARFMNDYRNRLENHGCSVELHNPYEESYEVLKGKLNRAEIVLVCERHVPHSIWNYVDRNQPYVTVLKKDSKDLISSFTYLTLCRCELI
ncbi:hypothetical protein RRU94_15660 [Domibacillus sp. DTU_2020_1001157_1_SI_ALB_TIR_016]|uniref:hypothetical protein n=1 Tax=Domibacillus sp. DTU_2020_1001157_1_SI_ALB_TIR_016 TaxID=3077789 RepID=UPI0028E8F210|nr:hypothetical protein [Domibacillus sp. DTU_2020_1001157_1_SI_ALB_TIR_016]WNS82184.1 hypothetical protein RRU94_15660 [Domibacillus sp. DTU_2020_1001157_1_SI_ALB_TIR_016]